jgi:hypothetical protein
MNFRFSVTGVFCGQREISERFGLFSQANESLGAIFRRPSEKRFELLSKTLRSLYKTIAIPLQEHGDGLPKTS